MLLLLLGAGDTRVIGGRRGVWAWATTVWVAVGILVPRHLPHLVTSCHTRAPVRFSLALAGTVASLRPAFVLIPLCIFQSRLLTISVTAAEHTMNQILPHIASGTLQPPKPSTGSLSS